ncbi:metal ABC transporter substrate-binding protein [Azospira sp. APE16]|uniref:metal ABC transporter substrate-binding protein n=1 Tax=Azospira sp. APE16 TaxID=3394231 RepID=UPI001B774C33|nr:zinc ABC transporter substrate-binding protein [Azospira sp.]
MQRLIVLLLLAFTLPAQATLNVLATVPEWAALVKEIGGDKVNVVAATNGLQDPHRIEAKPSLIARGRNAQLLVATGAELEVGWLPLVQRESGNPAIQSGQPGYFEAARYVTLREVPAVLDRSHGDVHAGGNPHIQTDPRLYLKIGEALAERLALLDPAQAQAYQAGYRSFAERWKAAIARWEAKAAPLKGVPVLVQHDAFPYLNAWLGLKQVGVLEQKPGMEPSSGYLAEVLARQQHNPGRMVLRPAYQYDAPSRWIADKAGIPAVILPFTVGGTAEAKDLFSLFDDTVNRLLAALR